MHACVRLEGRLQEKRRGEQMHRFILQSDRQEVLGVSRRLSHLPWCCLFRPSLSSDRPRLANPEERKKSQWCDGSCSVIALRGCSVLERRSKAGTEGMRLFYLSYTNCCRSTVTWCGVCMFSMCLCGSKEINFRQPGSSKLSGNVSANSCFSL